MEHLAPFQIEFKIKQSLEGSPYEASALTQLSGGSVNWTYSADLVKPLDDGSHQVFIKHAETFMKAKQDTPLPLDRADREAECFKHLSETHLARETEQADSHSIVVRTPKYYHYDKDHTNQILELMPRGMTLREYAPKYYALATSEQASPAAREIGKSLGSWLKRFTEWAVSHTELRAIAEKNSLGQYFRHLVTFGWLQDRAEQYPGILGDAKELLAEVQQAADAELKDPNKVQVVHGDFWPGNILLPNAPITSEKTDTTLFVVDLEMLHLNVPSVDYAQMLAEFYYSWAIESIPAGRWMMEGFVEAYGTVTEEFAYRTAVQMGAHMICAMTDMIRLPPEQREKAVSLGKEILVHAWDKDRAWFEDSELACIFRQVK